jgi:hypothetical protein
MCEVLFTVADAEDGGRKAWAKEYRQPPEV